jgi:nucleotide-binding universal stress UspA family protein
MSHNVGVYQNVIVPFDGSLPARAALAPAADLAWRCGGRIVVVNNTEASDSASRDALKSRAMSMSGADVDFWVDLDHSIGRAVIEVARYRDDPVVCIPVRTKTSGWRRKPTLGRMAAEVLLEAPAPVLVIGPEADVSTGLGMSEVVVALDGSADSEQILPIAVDWAKALKLRIVLAGVVRAGAGGQESHTAETGYLRGHLAKVAREVPDATFELIEAVDPATGLCGRLAQRADTIIAMSTHGRSGVNDKPLGRVSQAVMLRSPRPILFVRPRD